MIYRAILTWIMCTVAAPLLLAQAEQRAPNRTLAFALADAAAVEDTSLRLSLPPATEPLLGAIVVRSETGFRVLDRLPAGSFEASTVWEAKEPLDDSFMAAAESPLIRNFVENTGEIKEPYRTTFEATNASLKRLTVDSLPKAKKFILSSRAARDAAAAKSSILLVTAAFSGRVKVRFELQDTIAENASPIAKAFTLSRPQPTVGLLELESAEPVEFAYQLDVIDLVLNADGSVNKAELRPAGAADNVPASAWEKTQTVFGSAPENFFRVKVFYATDRNLAPPTPEENKKTWWLFFVSYFLDFYPYLAFAVAAALGYLTWWQVKWFHGLGRWPHGVILGLSCACAVVLGSVYARQQTDRPGTIAKEPVTAHRGELTYGTCEVSIPKNHKIGELARPFSLFLIDLEPENPNKTISVLKKTASTETEFFDDLEERLKDSPHGECFVFVHGYNNTFDNAAQRTAQLWFDLQFQGAPIFFSWPSRGATAGYTFDETEATWAQTHFETFLTELRKEGSVKRIHIIAHSMGNRIVTGALANLAAGGDLKTPDCKFREVILAAADIDADTFKTGIAPKFINQTPRVTFYASANDGALKYSYTVHDYPRAGDASGGVMVLPGMDSIDASLLDTSFENHSYFAAQRSVVSDIESIFRNGLPPSNRGLREIGNGDARHWVFRP